MIKDSEGEIRTKVKLDKIQNFLNETRNKLNTMQTTSQNKDKSNAPIDYEYLNIPNNLDYRTSGKNNEIDCIINKYSSVSNKPLTTNSINSNIDDIDDIITKYKSFKGIHNSNLLANPQSKASDLIIIPSNPVSFLDMIKSKYNNITVPSITNPVSLEYNCVVDRDIELIVNKYSQITKIVDNNKINNVISLEVASSNSKQESQVLNEIINNNKIDNEVIRKEEKIVKDEDILLPQQNIESKNYKTLNKIAELQFKKNEINNRLKNMSFDSSTFKEEKEESKTKDQSNHIIQHNNSSILSKLIFNSCDLLFNNKLRNDEYNEISDNTKEINKNERNDIKINTEKLKLFTVKRNKTKK